MERSIKLEIIALLSLVFCATCRGEILRTQFEGVRPLGMGNAFIAIADDANALWYNPAALAQGKGIHVNLLDTTLGVDSIDTFNRVANAVLKGDTSDLIRTDQEYIRGMVTPSFIFPILDLQFMTTLKGSSISQIL